MNPIFQNMASQLYLFIETRDKESELKQLKSDIATINHIC